MELKLILEALLFSAQKALNPAELRDFLSQASAQEEGEGAQPARKHKIEEIEASLEELAAEHEAAGRSFRLVCVAGAWQFVSRTEYAPWLRALVGQKPRPPRLTQAALETLAIVAYRQPLTRAEIEQVRGVSVDGVMQTLLERELIEQTGRAEVAGRPRMYGTTARFLEYFGLRAIEDLPAADELRRVPVQKPAGFATVEPGLATAPPPDLTLPVPQVEDANASSETSSPGSESTGSETDRVLAETPETGADFERGPHQDAESTS
jgi:segregation and condensation protein B